MSRVSISFIAVFLALFVLYWVFVDAPQGDYEPAAESPGRAEFSSDSSVVGPADPVVPSAVPVQPGSPRKKTPLMPPRRNWEDLEKLKRTGPVGRPVDSQAELMSILEKIEGSVDLSAVEGLSALFEDAQKEGYKDVIDALLSGGDAGELAVEGLEDWKALLEQAAGESGDIDLQTLLKGAGLSREDESPPVEDQSQP